MEPILYISPHIREALQEYCESSLIDSVLDNFASNHPIVHNSEHYPNTSWVIDGYIETLPTEKRKDTLSVILTFTAVGGIVQLYGINYRGDANLLNGLMSQRLITQEELEFFIDSFFNIRHNLGAKFHKS